MITSSLRFILTENKLVTESFLNDFKDLDDASLFDTLIQQQCLSETALLTVVAKALSLEHYSLNDLVLDPSCFTLSPASKRYVPIYDSPQEFAVAVSNPFVSIENPRQKPIKKLLVRQHELKRFYSNRATDFSLQQIVSDAIAERASDIHFFQSDDKGYTVQFRCEGHLTFYAYLKADEASKLLQEIKLEGHMDLGYHIQPNDGSLTLLLNDQALNLRVATLPSYYGEDIAIRLFQEQDQALSFEDLGMHQDVIEQIKTMTCHESGLILVTGPTGSGKSTTLYAMLKYMQTQANRNIVSLEDPVEKVIHGVRQSSINDSVGYSFAKGLKAVLRQDPDVIMIGEIRDAETAAIAIQAAYTGHLVLSTLHTSDVFSSLKRLQSLDCDEFLVDYALKGIVSQRLESNYCEQTQGFERRLRQQALLVSDQRNRINCFEARSIHELGQVYDAF